MSRVGGVCSLFLNQRVVAGLGLNGFMVADQLSGSLILVMQLLFALGVTLFCGYGISRLCGGRWQFMSITGYAASQVLFFLAYFVFFDADMAVVAVLVISSLINGGSLLVKRGGVACLPWRRESMLSLAAGGLVLLLAAWPYLLAGWGNYWHSGNEDAFDAISGRDAFVHKEVVLQEFWDAMNKYGFGGENGLGGELHADPARRLVAVYANDLGRLQYSSTAFWSVVLDARQGMDAWLVQGLLNLLWMGHGLVLLLRRALPIGQVVAMAMAVAAVANNFYLTTYFNGHQGSLMFAAAAPYGLLLLLEVFSRDRSWVERIQFGAMLSVLLFFVMGAYPYPLPFFVFALFSYWILQRYGAGFSRRFYLLMLLTVLLVVFYVGTWYLFEPIRVRALGQFRSWGTVFNFIGFFQFWGVWPSMLASASVEFMNKLVESNAVMAASYLIGGGLSGLAAYGLYRAAKLGHLLLVGFAVMWLVLFPFMRNIVGDSYYFYKFLYLNNFFVVALMIFGYLQVKDGDFTRLQKIAAGGLVGIWVSLNLLGNLWATWVISIKPYNAQASEFRALIPLFGEKGKEIYVDLPKRGTNGAHMTDYESVVRNYLWGAGLRYKLDIAQAKYLLRMNGMDDVVEPSSEKVVWQSSLFRLVEAPDVNLMQVKSFWAPEGDRKAADEQNGRFRWVSDGLNSWLSVDLLRPGDDAGVVHFCAESGPSVDYRPLALRVSDGDGQALGDLTIENLGCYWIDVKGHRGPFKISSDVMGHVFSPIEMRHLNYRVFNVGVGGGRYDLATLRHLNSSNDITPPSTALALRTLQRSSEGGVFLANGWYGLERQGEALFRWARSGAQLVVDGCPSRIALDIEPGPSLGKDALYFSVRAPGGRIVSEFRLNSRTVVEFPVDLAGTDRGVFELLAKSDGLAIPGDRRRLDFRVFQVARNKNPGAVGECAEGASK